MVCEAWVGYLRQNNRYGLIATGGDGKHVAIAASKLVRHAGQNSASGRKHHVRHQPICICTAQNLRKVLQIGRKIRMKGIHNDKP